jgi:hypothetical protein
VSFQFDDWRSRAAAFAAASHELFAQHETSKASRVISLTQTWRDLEGLSLLQEALFRDALLCIERGLYRAAHVMSWAGFMDLVEERMTSDGLAALRRERPKWKTYNTVEELRENVVEYQLLDACARPRAPIEGRYQDSSWDALQAE